MTLPSARRAVNVRSQPSAHGRGKPPRVLVEDVTFSAYLLDHPGEFAYEPPPGRTRRDFPRHRTVGLGSVLSVDSSA